MMLRRRTAWRRPTFDLVALVEPEQPSPPAWPRTQAVATITLRAGIIAGTLTGVTFGLSRRPFDRQTTRRLPGSELFCCRCQKKDAYPEF